MGSCTSCGQDAGRRTWGRSTGRTPQRGGGWSGGSGKGCGTGSGRGSSPAWMEKGSWTGRGRSSMAASFRQTGGEEVGLAKVGKGTKRMPATDGEVMPLASLVTGADRAEVKLAEAALNSIRVSRARGRPRKQLERLVADLAYDCDSFRRWLRGHGVRPCIPPRRRGVPGALPSGPDLRLGGDLPSALVRHERLLLVYAGFFTLACIRICLGKLGISATRFTRSPFRLMCPRGRDAFGFLVLRRRAKSHIPRTRRTTVSPTRRPLCFHLRRDPAVPVLGVVLQDLHQRFPQRRVPVFLVLFLPLPVVPRALQQPERGEGLVQPVAGGVFPYEIDLLPRHELPFKKL